MGGVGARLGHGREGGVAGNFRVAGSLKSLRMIVFPWVHTVCHAFPVISHPPQGIGDRRRASSGLPPFVLSRQYRRGWCVGALVIWLRSSAPVRNHRRALRDACSSLPARASVAAPARHVVESPWVTGRRRPYPDSSPGVFALPSKSAERIWGETVVHLLRLGAHVLLRFALAAGGHDSVHAGDGIASHRQSQREPRHITKPYTWLCSCRV